jgi:hypothetical protein
MFQNRDCAEFGICDISEESHTAHLNYLMKKIEDGRAPAQSQIAFDCGSSGSNIQIVGVPAQCEGVLQKAGELKKAGLSKAVKAKGGPDEGCTVGAAFKTGAQPSTCTAKWDLVASWATKLGAVATSAVGGKAGPCFAKAQCWAAGTAGNRLLDATTDADSWRYFKEWTIKVGLCAPEGWRKEMFTSQPGSLTIPGVMEAAMEVETILAHDSLSAAYTANAVAFGSAGGSSAQFGICLSCAKKKKEAKAAWKQLLKDWTKKFRCANYLSSVDALEDDFLNTYTASDGGVWGVGSFLGNDKATTLTPIGGMNAMEKGLQGMRMEGLGALTSDAIDTATVAQIEDTMKVSQQGKFAAALKTFVTTHYSIKMENVRFVAKTSGVYKVAQKGILTTDKRLDDYTTGLTSTGNNAKCTKLAYAYMDQIGLVPPTMSQAFEQTVEAQMQSEYMEGSGDPDEYEWLETAAKIGFGDIKYGKFEEDVTGTEPGETERRATVTAACR